MSDKFLTPSELADRWNLSTTTLYYWRKQKKGPKYIQLEGARGMILYPLKYILEYEEQNTFGTAG